MSVPSVDIGSPENDHSSPDSFCLLSLDDTPLICARLWRNSNESYPFREACYWRELFIIGWGNAFYVIKPKSASVTRHELGTYFGNIHASNFLLIASAERAVRLSEDGAIAWISEPLGIDGVTILAVDDRFVSGNGEWDPPGGWKPFRLHLPDGVVDSTGESLGNPEAL